MTAKILCHSIAGRGKDAVIMVSAAGRTIRALPNAGDGELAALLSGKRVGIFLDHDGTLTPIADRLVGQRLMQIDDPVVAGGHGFDIWTATGGPLEPEGGKAVAGPGTHGKYVLHDTEEVARCLDGLGR
jgi:hypothetical protein